MDKINRELKKYFGYDEFRPGQYELIKNILAKRDVLSIMPTGGGKSLCYQLPAVIMEGVSLVISPLISLMKDQVDSLLENGIASTYINSSLSQEDYISRMNDIENMKYKLIYLAPERLDSPHFLSVIKRIKVDMIAIDEAHCISKWGHDFRPAYRKIPRLINELYPRPIVSAFTATATKEVTKDILSSLQLKDPYTKVVGFDRPNLYFQLAKPKDKFSFLVEYLEGGLKGESGIIYAATRDQVEKLSEKLNSLGYNSVFYHGGMSSKDRQLNQDKFIYDQADIIVATNAFGMGIDKPNVRYVVHYNMPQNMESYYQEAGRAGRDGEAAQCLLLYSNGDIVKQKYLIESSNLNPEREELMYKNLQSLIDYSNSIDCLRVQILDYFGEKADYEKCNNCSNCLDESELVDITREAQMILSCIYRVGQRYGIGTIIQVLRGSRSQNILNRGLDKLSTYNLMADYKEETLREIIMTLISKGYIYQVPDKFPILLLTKDAGDILNGKKKVYHRETIFKERKRDLKEYNLDYDQNLYQILSQLRRDISEDKSLPPYMIFSNESLKEMAYYLPLDREELLKIKGVGFNKMDNYGESFLRAIQSYMAENQIEKTRKKDLSLKTNFKDRYELTYQEYLKGLTLDEISQSRGFTQSTIVNHLKKMEDSGKLIDWARFISLEKEEEILQAVDRLGLSSLKDIKDNISEDISYTDIKICLNKNKLI